MKTWSRFESTPARTVKPLLRARSGATEADLVWTLDGVLLTSHEDVL